ncbi:hypothetical protein ELH40_07290 [Rhizobium ruizarguesonis]|uniref:Uncharacterized protein n=1 Tax=Rhizobium ruizarguesonis TaxID=2081791 RepID=A0AB38I3K8_9HYPH|nr:hypothetical protein [Rhizobium leguminosarum bv. viciae]TBC14762.1 hypothetical protein ELH40_07290 [Rhizobium ruizarguesonis]
MPNAASRLGGAGAAYPFSPRAGRRCRQADEGQAAISWARRRRRTTPRNVCSGIAGCEGLVWIFVSKVPGSVSGHGWRCSR